MPFRFNRRVGIVPGLRLNLGKRGVSLTEGVRGAGVTLGTRGVRVSLGIPGTGFGWFTQSRWSRGRRASSAASPAAQPRSGWAILGWVVVLLAVYVMIAIGGGH